MSEKTLQERAEEMGMDSVEEYVEWLEAQASGESDDKENHDSRRNVEDKGTEEKPSVPPVRQKHTEDAGSGVDDDVRRQLRDINAVAAHAVLEAQYGQYRDVEREKDAGSRRTYSKEDMMKLIKDPVEGIAIQRVAAKFNDNLWEAAAYLLDLDNGISNARKEGAESAEALNRAKKSTQLAEGKPMDVDDDDFDPAKALADEIAPAEGGYTEPPR